MTKVQTYTAPRPRELLIEFLDGVKRVYKDVNFVTPRDTVLLVRYNDALLPVDEFPLVHIRRYQLRWAEGT